jgi:hypothetical protein
MDKKS